MAADTDMATLVLLAIAGATLIAIIRIVSDGPVGKPPSWHAHGLSNEALL